MAENFMQTLTSMSGSDLIVNFGSRVIGELQQISWGITRQKAPVYTLGSPDPRSFSRGKRGIAGTLVFATFDRDALIQEMKEKYKVDPYPTQWTAAGHILNQRSYFENALTLAEWNAAASQNIDHNSGGSTNRKPAGFELLTIDKIAYVDQLPPIDVTCTWANEYGQSAFMKIFDLEFLNDGSGVSVDTVVMERAMTWVARRISPITTGIFTAS